MVADLVAEDRAVTRVGIKLRYAPFETRTRSRTLPEPTLDETSIVGAAVELLADLDRGRAVRLLGVRIELEKPSTPA